MHFPRDPLQEVTTMKAGTLECNESRTGWIAYYNSSKSTWRTKDIFVQ